MTASGAHGLATVLVAGALLAAAPAQAADWVLRVDGAGPLRVGMKFDTVNRILGEHMARPFVEPRCFYIHPAAEPGVRLLFVGDVLRKVDVEEAGTRSERGAAIGDTLQRLRQIYGEALQGDAQEHLTVRTGGNQYAIRFLMHAGVVSAMHAGDAAQVAQPEC